MSSTQHLLVVDDDRELRGLIGDFLKNHGYAVSMAANSAEMDKALGGKIDLIILDLMMPGEDGLSIIRRLRSGARPPIIMLSAMGEDHDRIIGLEVGADDYLSKPCNPRELLARVRAVLRRAEDKAIQQRVGRWVIDHVNRALVGISGEVVSLTDAEYRVLIALSESAPRVVSRDHLIETTRGVHSEVFDRAVDVTISRLRKKLGSTKAIRTMRNQGYRLVIG